MNKISFISIIIGIYLLPHFMFGSSNASLNKTKKRTSNQSSIMFDCSRPTAFYDMNVNNVRARLHNGGSLFEGGQYITPNKASGTSNVAAIYAAGIWVGGVDRAGNIRLSASNYKQNRFDFFPGPLDFDGVTEKQYCDDWDKIFTVKGKNIDEFISAWNKAKENNVAFDCSKISDDIKYWPAQGNPYWNEKYPWPLPNQALADYWDNDSNGKYDPCKGDYPIVLRNGCVEGFEEGSYLPAEINFFIFNDNGGPQTLSGMNKIQMEVQVTAFAYNTKDEVNDMTFYQYKLVNKASEDLLDFYFSFWIDPDLGCYNDDYFGYDKTSEIAYIYNQDAVDGDESNCGGVNAYGENIPMVGLTFLQKPYSPKVFVKDANGKFIYDQFGQKVMRDPEPNTGQQDTLVEIGISSFTYTDNCTVGQSPVGCPPQTGREVGFYNIMRGLWTNGAPMTFGGSGYNPGSTDTVKHLFSGSPNNPNEWSMCTVNFPYFDGKFNVSTGPLLLQPGATNIVTVNVFSGFDVPLPCPDLTKMRYVKGAAEFFLGNCTDEPFQGPDAPDMSCIEKDQELILMLENNNDWSNNYQESFNEVIPFLPSGVVDNAYKFEGYKIYQLKDEFVDINKLDDPSLARLVAQTDIKNNVADIYNWVPSENPDTTLDAYPYIWQPKLMVSGENLGINHAFTIFEDQFAEGDKTLQNGKKYFFTAKAYAHNEWKPYDINLNFGQRTSYIESRFNRKIYTFTPRKALDKVLLVPNPVSLNNAASELVFFNLPKDSKIHIVSVNGIVVKEFSSLEGDTEFLDGPGVYESRFQIGTTPLTQGLYLVVITDNKSGEAKTLKWLVL